MAASVVTRKAAAKSTVQGGFSLIEVVISMAVLTVGLVSLLGVFGIAMASTQTTQEDMLAKQIADEAIEAIMTARDTAQLQWTQIENTSNGGIFLDGYQQIYTAGADGIIGTADDVSSGQPQTLIEPGPDGIYGTADDVKVPLTSYQRKILIQPVLDNNGNLIDTLRSVTISIQYTTPRVAVPKTYVLTTFVSQFR